LVFLGIKTASDWSQKNVDMNNTFPISFTKKSKQRNKKIKNIMNYKFTDEEVRILKDYEKKTEGQAPLDKIRRPFDDGGFN
jgi:hypothetical protein